MQAFIVLLLHYAFWFWQFRPFFVMLFRGWGGAVAIAPIVGFCSALAWIFYLGNVEPELTRASSGVPA
jgi:hypothetical protein